MDERWSWCSRSPLWNGRPFQRPRTHEHLPQVPLGSGRPFQRPRTHEDLHQVIRQVAPREVKAQDRVRQCVALVDRHGMRHAVTRVEHDAGCAARCVQRQHGLQLGDGWGRLAWVGGDRWWLDGCWWLGGLLVAGGLTVAGGLAGCWWLDGCWWFGGLLVAVVGWLLVCKRVLVVGQSELADRGAGYVCAKAEGYVCAKGGGVCVRKGGGVCVRKGRRGMCAQRRRGMRAQREERYVCAKAERYACAKGGGVCVRKGGGVCVRKGRRGKCAQRRRGMRAQREEGHAPLVCTSAAPTARPGIFGGSQADWGAGWVDVETPH
eukprot:365376-Chlamydomonas_euryale.AAC.1